MPVSQKYGERRLGHGFIRKIKERQRGREWEVMASFSSASGPKRQEKIEHKKRRKRYQKKEVDERGKYYIFRATVEKGRKRAGPEVTYQCRRLLLKEEEE